MPQSPTTNEAWIAAAVAALNRHGSWTGRIHVHKHLYLTVAAKLVLPPFDFVLYQYGPYSYDVDSQIAQMELYGQLVKSFPSPGYGPRYQLTELGSQEASLLAPSAQKALDRVAKAIGDSDSQTLELQATCWWVEHEEGVLGDEKIIQRVKHLKPRYEPERIAKELSAVHVLVNGLMQ